jgi:AcrR family transcriptional regulator
MKSAGTTKREKQKTSTRNRLLQVARRQFAQKGLMATSTLDIAREAEVSHGTIFAHFPTREDLIVNVIEEFGEQMIRRIYQLSKQGMGVRDLLAAHLKGLEEYEPFYARLVMEAPVLPMEARITLIAIQSAVSFHLYMAAKREMKAGTLRPLPMHLLFNTWIGLVHHYLNNRDLFAPGESVIARRGQELLDHYMSLLSLPKGGPT